LATPTNLALSLVQLDGEISEKYITALVQTYLNL